MTKPEHLASGGESAVGVVSYLPMRSGDGYNYGGGLLVTFGKTSLFLGEVDPMRGYDSEAVRLAHLIAAAPELLALAQFVVDHPNAARGMGDTPHALWEQMQMNARAVLAKARPTESPVGKPSR